MQPVGLGAEPEAAPANSTAALPGSRSFIVATLVANGIGLLFVAFAGRALPAAAAADFFAAMFLVQAIYMAGHPFNTLMARTGAAWTAAGEQARVASLAAYLLWRWAAVTAAIALAVALTFELQTDGFQIEEPAAWAFAWACGALVVALGVLRGALRGALLLGALAASFVVEAALRLGVGAALLGHTASATSAVAAHGFAAAAAVVGAGLALRRHLRVGRANSDSDGLASGPAASPPIDGHDVLRQFAPLLLLSLLDASWQNADALLAKAQLLPRDAAGYGAVTSMARLFGVIAQPFALLVIPAMAADPASAVDGGALGRTRLGRLWLGFGGLSLAMLAPLANWPGAVLTVVFVVSYASAAPLVLPLALASLAAFATLMLGQAFAASGRFGFLAGQLALLALAAAGLWWLAPRDAVALAWAVALAKGACLGLTAAWWRWERTEPGGRG